MLDLTVIILTKDEHIHIGRCLKQLTPLGAKKVVVVDSESGDDTVEIAERFGAEVKIHHWPGNQATQFNWALDNLNITTEWILRLDADEYLLPELIEEIKTKLPLMDNTISGITLKRRHIFMGRWMKRGIYPVKLLRLFRNGIGRSENRLMDEHILLTSGKTIEFENDFCDHNLNNLSWFCQKHINYAVREAAEMLCEEISNSNTQLRHTTNVSSDAEIFRSTNKSYHTSYFEKRLSEQAGKKRRLKGRYASMPLFVRSLVYFLYRYLFCGAFLDGKEGFLFSFIQGWWYRTLVDAKILEIKRKSNRNPEEIKRILKEEYQISIISEETIYNSSLKN